MAQPRGRLVQAVLILAVAFAAFRYGIQPPIPFSVLSLYMAITVLSVLVYVSSDSDSWRSAIAPLWATLVEPRRRPLRLILGVVFPVLVGYYAWGQASAKIEAPFELRAIHPAPPDSIRFRGKDINLQATDTPIRKEIAGDPAAREKHLAAGAAVYVRNCMYCHGDNLDGQGHFAHGFNPRPADFTSPNTIAQLSEGYLFWRIAKGAPGLPKEATPWNSAMPAWEDRLTEEEIWQVIYYLYETTGYPPRVMDTHAALPAPPPATSAGQGLVALALRVASAQSAGDARLGKQVYDKRCAACHGASGKGDGPAAELLLPRPRDFTAGKYKIRTTQPGQPPSDRDLFDVITEGMPGTSMPGWTTLDEKSRWALVAYLKTFSDAFGTGQPEALALPKEVPPSPASLARGRELFEVLECYKCHGSAGRGNPDPGSDLKDDWGFPIQPANLTRPWTFRGGSERRDVVARVATGVLGTPMPTFLDTVKDYKDFKKQESEEQKDPKIWETWQDASLWDLANYVRSLGPDRPTWASLLPIRRATGEVPTDPNADFWNGIPPASFPLVGQVILDPRNFNPSIDQITVRAVYTDEEVVFHLAWDDPAGADPSAASARPDMVALQFPRGRGTGDRPSFLMGESGKPVYLLTWRAGTGVGEALAAGIGKLVPQAGGAVQATGAAVYDAGQYRVVLRRPRETPDPDDFAFPGTAFFPVAFWAWDGENGDEGPRASVSSWYYAKLDEPPSRRPWVVPPLAALATVVAELGLSRWARRRHTRGA